MSSHSFTALVATDSTAHPVSAFTISTDHLFNVGAGYDQIDVPACTSHKIHVSNTPGAVDDATADTAAWLIIGALRSYNIPMTALRENTWRGDSLPPLGHDPEGKVLGILGMGGIGRNLAQKMAVFGMRTIYHNRKKLDDKEEGGASYVGFEELLKKSDVISLNLPLNVSHTTLLAFTSSRLAALPTLLPRAFFPNHCQCLSTSILKPENATWLC